MVSVTAESASFGVLYRPSHGSSVGVVSIRTIRSGKLGLNSRSTPVRHAQRAGRLIRVVRDEDRWISFSCKSCKTTYDIEEYWVWKFGEDAWNDCECGEKCVRETPMVYLGEVDSSG